MSRRTRRTLSLLTLAVLMTAQVAPALEVCVCEMPGVMECCQTRAASIPEPSGCCSTEPSSPLISMSLFDASVGEASCQREVTTVERVVAARTSLPETQSHAAPATVEFVDPEAALGTTTIATVSLRAPPGHRSSPLYLLHASFRA